MSIKGKLPRRQFLKQAAGVVGSSSHIGSFPAFTDAPMIAKVGPDRDTEGRNHEDFSYPRVFRGRQLKMIAFPLGGVAAGSLRLGGRGQLRDWEIFNRPNKGFSPAYAFPAIWVQSGNSKPVARVLEARILPPYEGQDGLGSNNSPGLSRLETVKFTGEYPFAKLEFEDRALPVKVELEAFSPFIPHDPDDSGLPAAILRYRVTNPGPVSAKVGIAFSIDNPIKGVLKPSGLASSSDTRLNEYRTGDMLAGLIMSNSHIAADDPMSGSFVLASMSEKETRVTHWRGWPQGGWWNSPLLFWDVFSAEGQLAPEPNPYNTVGSLCQQRTIAAWESASFTFMLAWHFPNRTPEWCGWAAPRGDEKTVIGNFYCTRFKDAWDVAEYTAANLKRLEDRTRVFTRAFRECTLPAAVKEAAGANFSTLASTTCFRTADGEFKGFEGSNDTAGCCYGNCTHVWNYETATSFLFPSFARSLRKVSFGYSLDPQGAIHARQMLPDGKERDSITATDGHMGQILHAYLDWKLSGDRVWLQAMWPQIKKAIEFAWVTGGWDASKSGIIDGVQNNTYDVAFFGPNPMCGIYYLGALRAAEEIARSVGDDSSANEYRRIFEHGSRWIDSNLFTGEFYIQKIKGFNLEQISPVLRVGIGGGNTENPEYQMGEGCLIDQLIGQYLAAVTDLGPLVSQVHIRTTLQSIYKYNYKRSLTTHNNVERTFALNNEAAMVICDYGTAARPRIPFPYFAEVMTGFEYSTAALMIYSGMVDEGVECIRNIRARYDGEKRNPWDEAECGHHYARAMASWTSIVALSGFQYDAAVASIIAIPRLPHKIFNCFWATGTGWGTFSYLPASRSETHFQIEVLAGNLSCRSCEITAVGSTMMVRTNGKVSAHTMEERGQRTKVRFEVPILLEQGGVFDIKVKA